MSGKKTTKAAEPAAEKTAAAAVPRERTVKRNMPTQKEAVVYIGPRLPNGKLGQYNIFREGVLPAYLEKLVKEVPALKVLFVPASKLADSQRKLADSSSVLATRFAEVRKHFYKGAN